ncbi:MAG: 7-carboxy-7-deazaguanine synthase QueE [Bacteroidota bacterium]
MSLSSSAITTQKIPVMESFYTLQGEGTYQGKAAYFIRLGGCDVGCVWCDVKDSWDATKHPLFSVEEIVSNLQESLPTTQQKNMNPIVVITGGEPLMYDLNELTTSIREAGYRTHLETSGAHPLSGNWDWICLSPKKFKAPIPEICKEANELKVVIFHHSDLQWAELYAEKVSPECRLFLQPEWEKSEKVTPLIVEYIQKNPKWALCLQIHKYINVP